MELEKAVNYVYIELAKLNHPIFLVSDRELLFVVIKISHMFEAIVRNDILGNQKHRSFM